MMRTSRLPSQTDIWSGNAFDRAKQARKAADLRIHVGLAAFDDQAPRAGGSKNFRTPIGRSTQDAHSMILAEQDIFDRLVGDLLDPIDHLLRHHRGGLRIYHHDAVVADDHPGIGIAFGSESIEVGSDRIEADGLVGEVGCRGETRTHAIGSRSVLFICARSYPKTGFAP